MGRNGVTGMRSDAFSALTQRARRMCNVVQLRQRDRPVQQRDALAWMDRLGLQVDLSTYASLLAHHGHGKSLFKGKRVHSHIVQHGHEQIKYLNNLLVFLYGNCGALCDARTVFARMPHRNAFSWNIMIAACVQNDKGEEAIEIFKQMPLHGMKPDKVTFLSVLSVCADQAALCEGKQVHDMIMGGGVELDIPVGTALLNMYGRCGTLMQAREVFDRMPERNVIAWSAMIAAYGQHGEGNEAVELFKQMKKESIVPCEVAFISILSACSHTGLVDEGCHFFVSMTRDHGIRPSEEHYNCMIDMLGRAGRLNESEGLMKTFQPSVLSWITLLGACKMNLDLQRAIRAAVHIFNMDPGNAISHKLLSMIHSAAGKDVEMLDVSSVAHMLVLLKIICTHDCKGQNPQVSREQDKMRAEWAAGVDISVLHSR